MSDKLAVIILAAGRGTRMKSDLPKCLHKIAGRPMIGWLLETAQSLNAEKIITVISPDGKAVADAVAPHNTVIQTKARGTGDAVKAALPDLESFKGDVLILLADMPFISAETLQWLIKARHKDAQTGLSVLGAEFETPPAFGRLILDGRGALEKIVEDKDATDAERGVKLCNMGAFCVTGDYLADWVGKINNNNAQNEYYITDLVEIARDADMNAHVHVVQNHDEIHGVNSRSDLALLEVRMQDKLRMQAMESGATLIDPASTYFSFDTKLGRDVIIEPGVYFGKGVSVGDNVTIHAYSHIEGANIDDGAEIGPFARIRPQSTIEKNVCVGNFIEINRSHMKEGSKSKHLSYLGDATIGRKSNIGAGTVIANYDGFNKHETILGDNVFVGSNSTIVAPLEVGNGALLAAGSTITGDVPADALAIARNQEDIYPGRAEERRQRMLEKKEQKKKEETVA